MGECVGVNWQTNTSTLSDMYQFQNREIIYMSKDEKRRSKIGAGETVGNTVVLREKADSIKFLGYCIMSQDISLLTNRIKIERHGFDAYIFQIMCSGLNIKTGICHLRQKEIAEISGLSKSQVSKAIARLSRALHPDQTHQAGFIQILPELVREWSDGFGLKGFALHPDLVTIGSDKRRADYLWRQAGQQAAEKAAKIAAAAIDKAQSDDWSDSPSLDDHDLHVVA